MHTLEKVDGDEGPEDSWLRFSSGHSKRGAVGLADKVKATDTQAKPSYGPHQGRSLKFSSGDNMLVNIGDF